MCDCNKNQSPRERLAAKIQLRTNDGDDILDYLCDVFYDNLPGVLHGHRLQSARILVRYGHLSPFALRKLEEMSPYVSRETDRDQRKADGTLARLIRQKTGDADEVLDYLLGVMRGEDPFTGKRIKTHNPRLAAARELLKRGGYDEPSARPAPAQGAPGHTAPEVRPETDATDHTAPEVRPEADAAVIPASPSVIPAKAGIHTAETTQLITDDSELKIDEDEPVDYLAIVKRVVESMGPIEEEEEDDSGYQPDYSMWDMIEYPPLSEISEEHAQIGAALFHEAVERSRLWKQSNIKIPTRKDHDNYDDG